MSFFPELDTIVADLSGNVPSFCIWNLTTTIPFSPLAADSGIVARKLRLIEKYRLSK